MIELLVVLALIAIFALIGIPSYRNVTTTNRMAAEMNAFVGDLQYARSEAIKRGQYVTICASNNGSSCLGSSATNWSPGWIVFTDPNNNDTPVDMLRVQAALPDHDKLVSNQLGTVTFNRNGFTTQAQTHTLMLDDTPNALTNPPCAVLSTVGRIRVGKIKNMTASLNSQNCQ